MREKIADTVSECIKDVTGFPNITAGSKSLVGQLTPKLEALFAAETAALREEIKNLESTIDGLMNGGEYEREDSQSNVSKERPRVKL